jgi:hypothetical protein
MRVVMLSIIIMSVTCIIKNFSDSAIIQFRKLLIPHKIKLERRKQRL